MVTAESPIPVAAPWVHLEIGKLTLVTRTPYLISAAVKTPDPGSITEDLRGLVSDLSERIISHIIRTTHQFRALCCREGKYIPSVS